MIAANYELYFFNCTDNRHTDCPRFHEDVEFILPLTDGQKLFADNKIFPLRRGFLYVLPEAVLHNIFPLDHKYSRYIMHISRETLAGLSTPETNFFTVPDAPLCLPVPAADWDQMTRLLEHLAQPKSNLYGEDVCRLSALMRFLVLVFHLISQNPAVPDPLPETCRTALIRAYICTHIDEPLTLEQIASEFYISKYYLSHIFKADTNFSVTEYINNYRILKARQLLRHGMRVKEVGETVGFRSNEHFIRTFISLTGTSPKRYAQQYQSS